MTAHMQYMKDDTIRLFYLRLPESLGYTIWQYRLWSLQGRDTKLERFWAKNQL